MTGLELDKAAQMVVPPITPEERATVLAALARHDALDLEPMLLGDVEIQSGGPPAACRPVYRATCA